MPSDHDPTAPEPLREPDVARGGPLRSTGPLWLRQGDRSAFPSLKRDLSVDIAVVGGGVTGVTTALLLAEAGKRVALLEGRRIGSGVTGHTTAHLTEAIDARYHGVERKFGRDGAKLVRRSSREAIEKIAALSAVVGGAAQFRRVPGYLFTEDAHRLGELEEERQAAERAGADVELGAVPLPFATASGLCFRDQGQIEPGAYVAALAQKVARASADVFEGTPVVEIESGEPMRLRLAHGPTVLASAVVLATHAPFTKATFQLKVSQYRSYAVAGSVAEFPDALFWDLEDPYHYLRAATVAGKRWLVVGGEDHKTGKQPHEGEAAPFARLGDYAKRFGVSADVRWSAQVVESVDGLPFIGQQGSDPIFVATGFAGNGITFGTVSALMLTDALLGRASPYAELYRASRLKPLASMVPLVAENVDFPAHLVTDRFHGGDEGAEVIARGEGRVLNGADGRVAVYRDDAGRVHAFSAICTHMGCHVAFNALERSWDCPCHGSRFDATDGSVLDGPATTALEPKAL